MNPKIYVACLSSYNNGTLYGKWIDATLELDQIHLEIKNMLKKSRMPMAEEYAIHDYDEFNGLGSILGEYPDLEQVNIIALGLKAHGEPFVMYAEHIGAEYATAELFEDSYMGAYDSKQDFAREIGLGDVPSNLEPYIDYKAFANDLLMGDYWSDKSKTDFQLHIFAHV